MAPFGDQHGIHVLAYGTVCGGLLMVDAWGGWRCSRNCSRS
jgi:hypothetical protein